MALTSQRSGALREQSEVGAVKSFDEFEQPKWPELLDGASGTNLMRHLRKDTTSSPDAIDSAKKAIKEDLDLFKSVVDACAIKKSTPAAQFALLFLYDALREDSSLYGQCEEILKADGGHGFFLERLDGVVLGHDEYSADKAAWLLSSIMTNASYHYTEAQAKSLLDKIFSKECRCSKQGKLEATVNLLKSDFRKITWANADAQTCVLAVKKEDNPQILYKYMFALWMISYDAEIAPTLQERDVVPNIRGILATCRVEKVVRLGLVVIKNFLTVKATADKPKALTEDIVETSTLDVLNQLEIEKWRDHDLYDEIRDVSQAVAVQVSALSSFEKYEKEVATGAMRWGPLHSNKFWGENVSKFEQNQFSAVKRLCALLSDVDDDITRAVACHDIGEFAVLHPLGKKKIAEFGVKDAVMNLMSSQDRDVRREALLCCQKIMLNKWQDASQK